jgi:hypothetical protein
MSREYPDGFNLTDIIREVVATASDLNRDKMIAEVAQQIKPEDRDEALRQALGPVIDTFLTKYRRHTAIRTDNDQMAEGTEGAVRDLAPRSNRSAKVASIRQYGDYWRRALQEPYAVDVRGSRKRLADLSRDDLLFNIRTREDLARRAAAKALQLRGLLDLVTRHGVARVGDLPEAVLAETLVRAA